MSLGFVLLSVLAAQNEVAAREPAAPVAIAVVQARPAVSRQPCARGCLTPQEAIGFANQLAPKAGVAGEFELVVKAVGEHLGRYYLNSEEDYRDQRNLTVALSPEAFEAFAGGKGLDGLRAQFVGKRIAVLGVAARQTIDFMTDGKPTGKYYFQTHVGVRQPQQIAELADQISSTNRP